MIVLGASVVVGEMLVNSSVAGTDVMLGVGAAVVVAAVVGDGRLLVGARGTISVVGW